MGLRVPVTHQDGVRVLDDQGVHVGEELVSLPSAHQPLLYLIMFFLLLLEKLQSLQKKQSSSS